MVNWEYVQSRARRWFSVGPIQFQPSEVMKLALVLYVARYLADHPKRMRSFRQAVRLMERAEDEGWALVAADGSGQYRSVQEAINAAPQDTSPGRPWVIYVEPGVYHELIYVQREKHFVLLVGDDPL